MKNEVGYQSDHYTAIEWKMIFYRAGRMLSNDCQRVGIINANGFFMTDDLFSSSGKIKLIFERDSFFITRDHLREFSEPFINDSTLFLYKIRDYHFSSLEISEEYILFSKNIIMQSFHAAKYIFQYTMDHLSNRTYADKKIISIDTVQSECVEINMMLDHVSAIMLSIETLESASFLLKKLALILVRLSRLSGARALLKNNVLEIMFNLNFFIKFIEISR